MSRVPLFQQRPAAEDFVEARQWDGIIDDEWRRWLGYVLIDASTPELLIENRNGRIRVQPGDWIIKDDDGFYVLIEMVFNATFMKATMQ